MYLGSNALQEAKSQVRGRDGIKVVHLDVKDHDKVRRLVQEANVVIRSVQLVHLNESPHRVRSLLPAPFHPRVAKLCIEYKKDLVTASYISPEMRDLHDLQVCIPEATGAEALISQCVELRKQTYFC